LADRVASTGWNEMIDRAAIIETAIAEYRPGDGDLIRFLNYRLVYEGQRQLNCCERRDVLENYAAACTVHS
jgi:hypothetical protein